MKKELFKFITEKPSAITIWQTLESVNIEPSEGYTDFQIRFIYYCILKLHIDFKIAKALINKPTGTITYLDNLAKELLGVANDTTKLLYPPAGLPSWVTPKLYIPYYLFKQLRLPLTSNRWIRLFDRTVEHPTKAEADHIIADLQPITEYITQYKLWYYGTDIIHEKYSDIFFIDTDLPPNVIHSKDELISSLHDLFLDHLEVIIFIFDYSEKIIIHPFQLKATDAPQ